MENSLFLYNFKNTIKRKTKTFHMSLYFVTVALILSSGCMRQFALIFTNYDFSLLGAHMSIPSLSTKTVATNTIDNCFLIVLIYTAQMLFASLFAFACTVFYAEKKQIETIAANNISVMTALISSKQQPVCTDQDFQEPCAQLSPQSVPSMLFIYYTEFPKLNYQLSIEDSRSTVNSQFHSWDLSYNSNEGYRLLRNRLCK